MPTPQAVGAVLASSMSARGLRLCVCLCLCMFMCMCCGEMVVKEVIDEQVQVQVQVQVQARVQEAEAETDLFPPNGQHSRYLLLLVTRDGLANRLRSLADWWSVAQHADRELVVSWSSSAGACVCVYVCLCVYV